MPVSDPVPPLPNPADSSDYSNLSQSATPSSPSAHLKILSQIKNQGPIPFPDFLQTALYNPSCGYYAKQPTQVGNTGDFFTSVTTGPLFGTLLASRFLKWWLSNNQPKPWRILEIGAHTGQLAHDILSSLQNLNPLAWQSLQYSIIEPLPLLRSSQANLLHPFANKITITESHENLTPIPGIAFGNEILDALPFHLIKKISGSWQELHVSHDWKLIPLKINPHSQLAETLTHIPSNHLPENYQTEVRTCFLPFLHEISSTLTDGLLLFLDYGFASPEYYDPYRTSGTLRTFSKHRAADNPLESPGEIDITAHVDFTALTRAAAQLGYSPTTFTNQGSYLTKLATPLIQSNLLSNPKIIANFQTLTHPAHLGARFHAIEFSKNSPPPQQVLHRLAYTMGTQP
jgi:SAM-dependent MidA family methyltransferase